ncbi:hypothetical protein [Halogranum rubrum]|uniref:Uncharacterized protein n=1 Tax=Halogranum salarium B-1 TaxID=1210908 RepID=J2ZA63_9EURY|nr:hypothetical protein [Halogranum salarium]EJN57550.1 hypothetical protein HSB1_39110 [Halogranum salarium B-1]
MNEKQYSGRLTGEGFPHPYLQEALEFSVEEVTLVSSDGGEVDNNNVLFVNSDRRISLVAAPAWDRVVVQGTVEIPKKVFNATMPVEERKESEPPIDLTMAVRCRQTILRRGVFSRSIDIEVTEPGTYPVEVELEHRNFRGKVDLKPYLVRIDQQDSDSNYASRTGDRLASCDPWAVEVDETEDSGGFLHPRIEPFDLHDSFPGEEHLHYLHFEEPATPKLYLNANHGRLVDVLQNEGTRGADPRFRDVLFDYIEQSVWQELLLRTANDADPESDEVRHPWQEEVIDLFTDHLYDEDDGYDEVLRKLGEHASSGEDLDVLVHEIDRAIQLRVNHPDKALKLFQEGMHND